MKKYLLLLLTGLLLVATGCHRIPMYERDSGIYLKVVLHTELHPDMEANMDFAAHPELRDKVIGKTPDLVRACFYDVVSHELVAEDFLPATGGFVDLPAGVYDVVTYSLGSEATQVSGTETRAGGYAFTSRTGVRVKMQGVSAKGEEDPGETGEEEVPVIYEPDHIFSGRIVAAEVPVRPEDSETVILTAELDRVSESWSLDFVNVEGAERIQKADVYITGQAAGRYLWDGRTVNHPAALGFAAEIDAANGLLHSVFNSFGKYSQAESDVLVNVLVTTRAGARCRFLFDVTDQWLDPDNTAHRLVVEEVLEIPGDDYQGGGFDPVVNDWDGQEIPVILE